MREVIETLNSVNIKFMDSVFKISTSPAPDFNPLLPDGNHLNWRLNTLKKVKRSGTVKQVVTHSAIINVLLNTYCRKLPDAVNKKYCCF